MCPNGLLGFDLIELTLDKHEEPISAETVAGVFSCYEANGISEDSRNLVDRSKVIELERIDEASIPKKPVYHAIKRVFDVASCMCALVLLAVPMVVVAVAIKVESSGPVMFKQERLGKGGKPFVLYKFRTMYTDAEKDGAHWTGVNDVRITKVGKTLRALHIDELPQFVNVIKGDMSLIGPRPERAVFYDEFEQYIHGFSQRLMVRPGISGLAQVNGGYRLLPEQKILFDLEYIKNQSVAMDARCIIDTFIVTLSGKGAR